MKSYQILRCRAFALINALVFAKVMMIYEMFDPGRWLRKAPDLSDPVQDGS